MTDLGALSVRHDVTRDHVLGPRLDPPGGEAVLTGGEMVANSSGSDLASWPSAPGARSRR